MPDDSFTEFATAESPALFRSATLLCGDRYLAEDLVQETLAKIYVVWGRRRIDNPAAYAHTTLVRTFVSARRRRSAGEQPTETVPEQGAVEVDVVGRLDLLGALASLGQVDRAVLVLRFFEDLSVSETADALNLSSVAVRSRTTRALSRIKGLLDAPVQQKEKS